MQVDQVAVGRPDISRWSAFIYLALFLPVIAAIVIRNYNWNALISDTLLLISDFELLEKFSSFWGSTNSNPAQAMFDIFPSGHRLGPLTNVIATTLFGPGFHVEFFYITSAVLLTLSVVVMGRALGLRWAVSVAAGALLPLLIMPMFGNIPIAEDLFVLWPILYYSTAATVLVTALFWNIGEGFKRSALTTIVIVAILVHLSIVQIFHMMVVGPAMIAMGLGAVAASGTRKELINRLVAGTALVLALGVCGIFHYLYASGINGAQHAFPHELPNFTSPIGPRLTDTLYDLGEVFFNPLAPTFHVRANVAGAILTPLAQFGALNLAVFGRTRVQRIFGRTMVVWIVATALIIVVIHHFFYYTSINYLGPDPRDFKQILWPYYVLCLAGLVFAAADRFASRLVTHILVLAAVPLAAGTAAYFWVYPSAGREIDSWAFTRYPTPSPLVDFLAGKVGIGLDRPFRGTAFMMPTVFDKDVRPYGVWRRENTFKLARAFLGNGLGEYGLRAFNVPTLDQVTHNIAPPFYLLVRELLQRPGIDLYERHYGGVVTRLNEPIMSLLGLRYVIADYELPIGTERYSMPLPEKARAVLEGAQALKSPVRVFELPHPNLGNYSPTQVMRADTAKVAILAMAEPHFDGRQTFITDDFALPGNLVPATDAVMIVRLGGVAVSATSAGESVLVLPVQYSHCWQIVSGGDAKLFRANLMQLGVRFSGNLNIELREFFGPFWQSHCKMEDAADIDRLKMIEALDTVTDLTKEPGDGINHVPVSASIDKVVGDGITVSVRASGAPDNSFTLTSRGDYGEHYATLPSMDLTPGVYTLSMQVMASNARFLMIQMMDGANNGAAVDYLIPGRTVWIYKQGTGGKLRATVHRVDSEWYQLTLTTTLNTPIGSRVIIQLKDRGNDGAFRAKGETVSIRALKLERGETASP